MSILLEEWRKNISDSRNRDNQRISNIDKKCSEQELERKIKEKSHLKKWKGNVFNIERELQGPKLLSHFNDKNESSDNM